MTMFSNVGQFGGKNGLAYSESDFVARNATVGTGITTADTVNTFSSSAAMMTIFNSGTVSSGNNQIIVPVYLKLTAKTANTTASDFRIVGVLDKIDRYSSGGTALTSVSTAIDTRSGYTARTPKATIYFGELTLAATSAAKRIFTAQMSEAVLVKRESMEIWFGGAPAGASGITNVRSVPPIWIGRGCTLSLHELANAQTADAEFEVEFCYMEVGHPRFNS